MTINELKEKFENANNNVEKRINTIKKVCKKLNVDADAILGDYNAVATDAYRKSFSWLKSEDREAIVAKYAQEKEEWVNGKRVENYGEVYDYNYTIGQLEDNLYKLYEVENIARNWKVKLDKAVNEESEEKIEVIWNFLQQWRAKAREWYLKECDRYISLRKSEQSDFEAYKLTDEYKQLTALYKSQYNAENAVKSGWRKTRYESFASLTIQIVSCYHPYDYISGSYGEWQIRIDEAELDKVLDAEVKAKYKDLINRITTIVGVIEDASGLSIAYTGEINGIVIGDKGRAKVDTISAGGWNIQCFHFRTLVHAV